MITTASTTAADRLRALLSLPDKRPGAWEAVHVEALDDELQAVLNLLDEDVLPTGDTGACPDGHTGAV